MDWGIIGTALAVIFFVVTIVLAIQLARRKRSAWAYKTTNIIGLGTDAPLELKLTYNGKPVREVYRTTFIMFNKGTEPIRENDITKPITLHLEGGEVLNEPSIKRTSNPEVKFSAKKSGNDTIELGFKYLAHNDGAVFEVLHTSVKQIDCDANIIGAKMAYMGEFEDVFSKIIDKQSMAFSLAGLAAITGMIFLITRIDASVNDPSVVMAFFYALLFTFILINIVPRYFRNRSFPNWSREATKTKIPTSQNAKNIVSVYCHKCKTEKGTTLSPEFVTLKDERIALRAICPDCGSKLFRMLAE